MTLSFSESSSSSSLSIVDDDQKLSQLLKTQNDYALNGQYDKAKQCSNQIASLQKEIRLKKSKELHHQHICETESLDQAYQTALQKTLSNWESKFTDLNHRKSTAIHELQSKHKDELNTLMQSLTNKSKQPQNAIKYSKDYIALDKQEKVLVKLQKFDEAKIVKKHKEEQKQKDIAKWNKDKESYVNVNKVKMKKKHQLEMDALKKKFDVELKMMGKEKEKELEFIKKKFDNKKQELNIQQRNEVMFHNNANLNKKRQVGGFLMRNGSVAISTNRESKVDTQHGDVVYGSGEEKEIEMNGCNEGDDGNGKEEVNEGNVNGNGHEKKGSMMK